MKYNNNFLLKMSILLNVFIIFFGHLLGNLYIIQFISCGLAFLSCFSQKLRIRNDTKLWLIILVFSFISLTYSIDTSNTMFFSLMMLLIILTKIIYENSKDWYKYFFNIVNICSIIHVLFTILQLIVPNFVLQINSIILPSGAFDSNQELYAAGSYAGIAGQTSVVAFYSTICIAINFFKLTLGNNKKMLYLIILLLSIIALFLTGKRLLLLANILVIVFFMIYLLTKKRKNKLKYIFLFFSVVLIGYIAINNIPAARVAIEKNTILSDSGNSLNGRDILWVNTIEVFKNNVVIGIGLNSIHNLIGEYTHNVYIQLLAETGIVGTLLFIITFFYSLCFSVKKMNFILKNSDNVQIKRYICIATYMQIIFLLYCLSGNPLYGHFFIITYILSIAIVNSIKIEGE